MKTQDDLILKVLFIKIGLLVSEEYKDLEGIKFDSEVLVYRYHLFMNAELGLSFEKSAGKWGINLFNLESAFGKEAYYLDELISRNYSRQYIVIKFRTRVLE